MKVLFIDNFDSFTYNLVDEFKKRNCKVMVYRNDVSLREIDSFVKREAPDLMVVSPGPSSPKQAGNSMDLIEKYSGVIPIFGVCLGHQAIIEVFGGKVGIAPETVHGKPAKIEHCGEGIYEGIENPFQAGRYHSLCGIRIPSYLKVTAKTNNIVMGVRHKKHFVEGVQFHPESILTPAGGRIIENLIGMIK